MLILTELTRISGSLSVFENISVEIPGLFLAEVKRISEIISVWFLARLKEFLGSFLCWF